MVLCEDTSHDMTSASPKINSGLLNRFDATKSNCDVMPACVVTSFAHMPNDVYKGGFVRDERESESSSSPEIQRYEPYNKSFQYSQSSGSPDNCDEERELPKPNGFINGYNASKNPRDYHFHLAKRHNGQASESKVRQRSRDTFGHQTEREIPQQQRAQKNENRNNNAVRVGGAIDERSIERQQPRISTQPNSPKNSHPLKKRILFSEKASLSPQNRPPSQTSDAPSCESNHDQHDLSPSAFKPHKTTKPANEGGEERNSLNSSDILRQMYAAFGSAGSQEDNLTRFNPVVVSNDIVPGKSSLVDDEHRPVEEHNHYNRSQEEEEELVDSRSPKREFSYPLPDGDMSPIKRRFDDKQPAASRDYLGSAHSAYPYYYPGSNNRIYQNDPSLGSKVETGGSSKRKRTEEASTDEERSHDVTRSHNVSRSHKVSRSRDETYPAHRPPQPKISHDYDMGPHRSPLKRKHEATSSRFMQTRPNANANKCRRTNHIRSPSKFEEEDRLTPSSEENKRTRYSSSESTESPAIHHPNNLADMYKQGGAALPYMNPLLYPSAISAFGLPAAALPFGLPGIPQGNPLGATPNPLLFGANPYLANPLILREMLNQANMMSLLPNPNIASLSMAPNFPLEQLHLFQQLQNSALLQKQGMFNPGAFPPTTAAISAMQNPLAQAINQRVDPVKHQNIHCRPGSDARQIRMSEHTASDKIRGHTMKTDRGNSHTRNSKKRPPSPVIHAVQREHKLTVDNHVRPRNHSGSEKSPQAPPQDKRPMVPNHNSSYPPKQKNHDITNLAMSSKGTKPMGAPPRSSLKKRSEKKGNEKSKAKGNSNRKLLSEMPIPFPGPAEFKDEEMDSTSDSPSSMHGIPNSGKPASYKNLTRERRLVANARERTRVHTISSAFDELRTQIPSYSCNQKLSKLAILRIACSYIRTLSVLSGRDETTTFPQGVDQCTRVLQSESRARSRRKSNKAQIEWEMVNYERHKSRDEVDYDDSERQHTGRDTPDKCRQNSHENNDALLMKPHNHARRDVSDFVAVSPANLVSTDRPDDDVMDRNNDVDVESVEDKIDVLDDVTNKNSTHDVTPGKSGEVFEKQSTRSFSPDSDTRGKAIDNFAETPEICVE